MQPSKPTHNVLPNLDALRFLAFLVVLLAHAFSPLRANETNPTLQYIYSITLHGVIGVNFFFVLSGFLITRILLHDFDVHERFRVGRFYMRRTLRIWPVYFLVLALTQVYYVVLNFGDTNTNWLYYFLFLGNYHVIIEGPPAFSSLGFLWSIAVEEQFYLVWPWLLWVFRKNAKTLCVVVIAVSLLFRYAAVFLLTDTKDQLYFNSLSVMSDIATGALLACLTERVTANSISLKNWQKAAVFFSLLAFAWAMQGTHLPDVFVPWNRLALSLFFVYLIFHQVFLKARAVNVEAIPGLSYLGKISYGLYMYHAFTTRGTRYLFEELGVSYQGWLGATIYPCLALIFTIAVAVLSYELVEKNILRLKSVWAK